MGYPISQLKLYFSEMSTGEITGQEMAEIVAASFVRRWAT